MGKPKILIESQEEKTMREIEMLLSIPQLSLAEIRSEERKFWLMSMLALVPEGKELFEMLN